MVAVNDLAGEPGALVSGQCLGQGPLVNHDLDRVPGLFLARFHVDDERVVGAFYDQFGLAGQGGDAASEPEGVLALDANFLGFGFPLGFLLVEQGGVVQQPFGLVEVRGWLGPVLVVSLEPDGPLAGAFAGEDAGQPGGSDVGIDTLFGHITALWEKVAVVG